MSETKATSKTVPEKKAKDAKEPMFTGKKIATSLLAGFTLPFAFIICSTLSVFFNNADQLKFKLGDFMPTLLLISLGVFALVSALLLFTKGVIRDTLFSVVSGVATAAILQNFITTLTFKGLPGDGNTEATALWVEILNVLIWAGVIVAAVWFGVVSKHVKTGQFVLTYLFVMVIVMQVFSVLPSYITYLNADTSQKEQTEATQVTDEEGNVISEEELLKPYVSTNNLFEISEKENVYVFVLDRFDQTYYKRVMELYPEIKDSLDGFTSYDDNISLYPRTYPAVTSMITGVNQDFTESRTEYLSRAFKDSDFLKDLKQNNYKINLYISDYYTYLDVADFEGLVDNVYQPVSAEEIKIASKSELARDMFKIGAYFWAPEIFKPQDVSTRSVNEQVVRAGEYKMDDIMMYENLEKAEFYTQGEQSNFTFVHMRGCHSPFNMDENCKPLGEETNDLGDGYKQMRGCFKIVLEYINNLKKYGLYEDATIIITGDHAALDSTGDGKPYEDINLTALLVKESGQSGTPLKTSSVPVSQENLIPTIVKSAGIETTKDYGKAYSEETNDPDKVRYHQFQTAFVENSVNYVYEIKGSGKSFKNWTLISQEEIGSLYD